MIPPKRADVTTAAANTTCPALSGNTRPAIPYPKQTPAKMTGKKCPPASPL